MKLIIGGATGKTGLETLRQALKLDAVTSVIGLVRRPVQLAEGVDRSKYHEIILEDFTNYPEDVKKQLADADACIWTVAITPSKAKEFDWETVQRVCYEYSMTALKVMIEARKSPRALQFIYYSGSSAQRDQTKTPPVMPEYLLLRGRVENELLDMAGKSQGAVQVCCIKPGLIIGPGDDPKDPRYPPGFPWVLLDECAAATLKQCVDGIKKEPLTNEDLRSEGKAFLQKSA